LAGAKVRPIGALVRAAAAGIADRNTGRDITAAAGRLAPNDRVGVNAARVGRTPAGPKAGCPLFAIANEVPRLNMAGSDAVPDWNRPLPTKPADVVRVIAYAFRPYVGTNPRPPAKVPPP
jgi:hypothetical protein